MVAPDFLQSPRVREWLNGIEPAWTLLEFDSFNGLGREPSRDGSAMRLTANISDADLAASAVASNALRKANALRPRERATDHRSFAVAAA
jgi:hypothetical protein